ncbi:unnamed protein product [Periconia digitata]|uniref:Uncharacterized protein n=1 Tax=Periconia digitata TaxID=1303443 RepID=A0A9W4XXW2_9PLEO|nr:unnamed protein product [Periconia digitata]
MDDDDILRQPTRSASWQLDAMLGRLDESDPSDDDLDETIFSIIPHRQRSASLGSTPSQAPSLGAGTTPPLPQKSLLRLRPEPLHPRPRKPARNFSHPFRSQLLPPPIPSSISEHILSLEPQRLAPRRRAPRVPFNLKRCSSLETIHSVTTTHSTQDETPQDEVAPAKHQYPNLEHLELDHAGTEVAIQNVEKAKLSAREQIHSSSRSHCGSGQRYILYETQQRATMPHKPRLTPQVYQPTGAIPSTGRFSTYEDHTKNEERPRRRSIMGGMDPPQFIRRPSEVSVAHSTISHSSTNSSAKSTATPTASINSSKRSSTSATSKVFRKLKSRPKEQPSEPLSLEIERRVSIDQHSLRTSSSGSAPNTSFDWPSDVYPSTPTTMNSSQMSQSSKDWKASNYDISHLSEAELKKCKKKGINPALYAEMKAARNGKLISPISGNTIL